MADARDFELLDDYLTNRMSETDRSAFEQKINADPDLKQELAVQKQVIKGIQDARVAELKSLLNKIAVPGNATGNAIASKILLGTVFTIMIAAAGYWYFNRDTAKVTSPENVSNKQIQEETPVITQDEPQDIVEQEESTAVVEKPTVQPQIDKNQTSAGTEHSKPSLAKRPDPLQAPAAKPGEEKAGTGTDSANAEAEQKSNTANNLEEGKPVAAPDNSSLVVEVTPDNGRYSFHYQFKEARLVLFGPFEQDGYDVIEFTDNQKQTLVLYHKDEFYVLTDASDAIRPLTPVSNPTLLKKLREYHSSDK